MKKIHLTFLWLALVAAFTACKNEVDDVFDKPSAERITEAIAKCRETLAGAKGGWVMQYYADTQYGGYNVLAKFNDNHAVTVQNEAYQSDKAYTSHFKVEQSQGVILSFDEYNPAFHFFSDPHNPADIGRDGKGMLGDFEFRVIKMSADSIVLKGKKHGSRVVMLPLQEGQDWNEYLNKLEQTEEKMKYSSYILHLGEKKYSVTKSYRQLKFTDPETGDVQRMPFIQTAEGFQLYRPFTYGGKTISGFAYSDDDKWLNPADNSVVLSPYVPPLVDQFVKSAWYVSYSKIGDFAKPYWDRFKEGADKLNNLGVIQMAAVGFMTFNGGDPASVYGLVIQSGGYLASYGFAYERIDDTHVKLWYTGKMYHNGKYFNDNGNYSIAAMPFGTKDAPRTFALSTDNLKAPTYITLTDENEPTNVITLSARLISNPFDH